MFVGKMVQSESNGIKCQCDGPGYCERYGRFMPPRLYQLCSCNCPEENPCSETTCAKYRALWFAQATDEPSLIRKALNFGKAAAKHIANGSRLVTQQVYEERIAICRACPSHLYFIKNNAERCKHPSCGCYLQKKLRWAEQECPKQHWSKG